MKGWVGLVGWPAVDGLPTWVVTRQLQVGRRTGKVRRPKNDILPLNQRHQTRNETNENSETGRIHIGLQDIATHTTDSSVTSDMWCLRKTFTYLLSQFVCLTVHFLKGKWLEIWAPQLAQWVYEGLVCMSIWSHIFIILHKFSKETEKMVKPDSPGNSHVHQISVW